MPKDLLNPDLWWSCHRSLNRASYSCYSNELRSIQVTIWIHTSLWLTWTIQQPAQRPLSLPIAPKRPLSILQPQESCFKVNPVPWHPWPFPQWTPSFLRVKFWFLKFYMPLPDLFPRPLCLIPSTPLPLNPLILSHSVPGCCFNIQALFCTALSKASLSQSISLTLATLLIPNTPSQHPS